MDDDFVPEGCVPLKSAVEQLAEARQTSIQSAQVDGRAKLQSGLMRAVVLRPDIGELLEILPRCWATETALRWFETGTCLLPNENGKVRITAERFDMFYQPENAPIFILEVDLKRLIGSATAPEVRRPVISDAEARRLFEEFRKDRGDIPTLKEDVSHMRQFGVSRRRVLALRKGVGVRRRPRGNPRRVKPG
jgi:hypothetical protein